MVAAIHALRLNATEWDGVRPSGIGEDVHKKGGVVHLLLSRGHCIAFWPSVPPLQVAPSFACSVASLSRSPGLQLPGCHSLHCGILADYLLGWGRPSTCSTGHAEFQSTSSPSPHRATGDWVLPAKGMSRCHFRINLQTAENDKKALVTHMDD